MRLPGISSRAYEHPADRSALTAMRKLTGFDVLLRRLAGLFSDRSLRLMFLASGVRVSERQFPHIYDMLRDGAYVLDLPTVPELFVTQNPLVNAMALGTDRPFIVITTGMVDLYDAEELRFAIGHELGHVLSGHAVYRTMLFHLINLARRIAWIPFAYVGLAADHLGARGVVPQVGTVLRPGRAAGWPGRGRRAARDDEDGGRRADVGTERRRLPRAGARIRRRA